MASQTHLSDEAQDNPFGPLISTPATTTALYSPSAFGVLLSLNSLSVLCSCASIVLLACLRKQQGQARCWSAQPVSIRLILYAAIIDILYTVFRVYEMFISQGDTRPASQPNCEAAMFGMTFFALLSVFIRALFSVHLHAVIVHDVSKLLRYEKRYIALSFAVALLLALLPMTRYAYVWIDYDPTLGSGHCSYFSLETIPHSLESMSLTVSQARRAVIAGILWCWATYFGWVALTVAYCALVIAAVIVRLWKERRRTAFLAAKRNGVLAANSTAEGEAQQISDIAGSPEHMLVVVRSKDAANVWPMAKKLLRRVAQFPATIILCHSLEVAWATATLARVIPVTRAGVNSITSDLKQLYMCMQIMISLQGVLTLLSLCLEPAIESLIAQWWRRYKCSGRYASTQQKASPSEPSAPHTQTSQNTLTKIEDLPWDIVICKPSALDDFCRGSGN